MQPPHFLVLFGLCSVSILFNVCSSFSLNAISRRDAIAAAGTFIVFPGNVKPAEAFDNSMDRTKFKDRPKRKGPQPTDLGIQFRGDLGDGLKGCGAGANCFSSTGDPELDGYYLIANLFVPPSTSTSPMKDVADAIEKYEVGHDNIDAGGFKIIKKDEGYVYAQFESLKNGYIDDVEFAVKDGEVLVRSSSRLGYLDYGVNAKRLNWIGKSLKEKGWKVKEINRSTHRDYFEQNNLQ
ncbi:hypothetical protein TrVE_jg7606 [Triparma verrucosa]|uniref:Uncharacterized protein n=1 Tax=Triparma verrucosa TaxID=1606542 RepID=A0A9W7EYW2_9STRA|nr:hypothetical protein TrVE_jg7606 [Triparma verrucosa]